MKYQERYGITEEEFWQAEKNRKKAIESFEALKTKPEYRAQIQEPGFSVKVQDYHNYPNNPPDPFFDNRPGVILDILNNGDGRSIREQGVIFDYTIRNIIRAPMVEGLPLVNIAGSNTDRKDWLEYYDTLMQKITNSRQ